MNTPFIRLNADQKHDRVKWLLKSPLAFAALALAAMRTRRTTGTGDKNTCQKGEFLLSSNECIKFGLKPTQHGKLERVIEHLEENWFIRDSTRKTTSGAIIFKLADISVFSPEFTTKE